MLRTYPTLRKGEELIFFDTAQKDGNNLLPLADKLSIVLTQCMYNFVFSSQLTKGIYASGWFVQMANNKCTPSINNYV